MKAVMVTDFGGPDVLTFQDYPMLYPAPSDVLVKVHAVGINRADIAQREGRYPPPVGESEVLGLEIAGEIAECGQNVKQFKKGDRICGLVAGGAYAEYCLLDGDMAIPIPDDWSYAKAAAVPEACITAQETVFENAGLTGGESVLIHAGASGVGSMAIQMAKYIDAEAFFTAGSADKVAKVESLSGGKGINYKEEDFLEQILSLTNNGGVDVIADFVGASYFAKNIELLKTGGRMVHIGVVGGRKAELDIFTLMRKRLHLCGFTLRSQPLAVKQAMTQRFKEKWLGALQSGQINPLIHGVYPFAEVADVHRIMEANENTGKLVLDVTGEAE